MVEKLCEMELLLGEVRESGDKVKGENVKLRSQHQKEREKLSHFELKLAQSEETIKFLEFDLSISRKKIEKLEEDLTVEKDQSLSMSAYHERHISSRTFIHDDAASSSSEEAETPSRPRHPRRDLSLTLRDDIMQDEELFLGMSRPADLSPRASLSKHFTFDNMEGVEIEVRTAEAEIVPTGEEHRERGFSFGTTVSYHIEQLEDVAILPPKKSGVVKARYSHLPPRKDPGEEFFILAVQAIKLNSPYMDEICTESPQELYRRALANKVPFHQWYPWIDDRLREVYLSLTAALNGGPMEIVDPSQSRKRK